MRIGVVIVLCSVLALIAEGQTLTIKENGTEKAISDVFIYHNSEKVFSYSDNKGVASLDDFPVGEIYLQHPSYKLLKLSYEGRDVEISMSEKIIAFNEVVVSANKWKQYEDEVAQKVITIDKKEIEFQNPQTSADLLAVNGQVFVQKSQLGGGSPKLRGFSANAVLLVVDGIRMNNAIFRSGNLQNVINIDPHAVATTEVVLGPGSVIYGSDAMGGVMNFSTIDPSWSTDDNLDVKANTLLRYTTAANERTGHIDFKFSGKRLASFHSVSHTSFDDLRAGSRRSNGYEGEFERRYYVERIDGEDRLVENEDVNLQRFSGYSLTNTIHKFKYKFSNQLNVDYGYYYSTTSDIPRYDNLTETIDNSDSLDHAEWYYGPQKWQMHTLKFNLFSPNSFFDQARLSSSFQNFKESRNDRAFGSTSLRKRTEEVDMYTISFDFDREINNARLYYGLDFYHNYVASSGIRRDIETGEITETSSRYPNGGSKYDSYAGYMSFVMPINNKWTVNTGVRYNYIHINVFTSSDDASTFDSNRFILNNGGLNGSLGLTLMANEHLKVSLNSATGFRSPNIDDIGKVFEVGTRVTVPNYDLKPEYSWNNDLNLAYKKDFILLRSSFFYSKLHNAIVEGPALWNGLETASFEGETFNVVSQVNATEAKIYGASAEIQLEIKEHFGFRGSVTLMDGKELETDEPLRHTTPTFGRASFLYNNEDFRIETYVVFNGNRNAADIPSTEIDNKAHLYTQNGSPGWSTLNVKSSVHLFDYMELNVGIENITDKHYRPYSSGISAPGRNFMIGLRASI